MSSMPQFADDSTRMLQIHRQYAHFTVFVQTDDQHLQSWGGKTIFLTVHDVGDTPQLFVEFVNHPSMAEVRAKSVFLHVCVPGQQDGAPDLVGDFPNMDQLGENLVHVLDALDVRYCIGIGEGAGADILCRFALAWPKRVLGLALIHCMDTAHGFIESFKEFFANLQLEDGNMNEAAWDYFFTHKYGKIEESLRVPIEVSLKMRQNVHNMSRYLYAYSRRTDIGEQIKEKMDGTDVLLVSGSKTPHNENVRHMYENMPKKTKADLLIIDDVNDVLLEAPDRFAHALILFCKGFGELSGVSMPGMERLRSPSNTMEEADRPSGRFSPIQSQQVCVGPTKSICCANLAKEMQDQNAVVAP